MDEFKKATDANDRKLQSISDEFNQNNKGD
jgi:hypothetical protein